MIYLLVNHIPWGRTALPDAFSVGDMWLRDLLAQRDAIASVGGTLIVAAPLVDHLTQGLSGSFNQVEICPADQGIEFFDLPFYISMSQYLMQRGALKHRLRQIIARCDIAQLGYGGHPVAIGQAAWPIAGTMQKKRIWLFDGADPFPRMYLHAQQERNPIKRLAKRQLARRFETFCRDAIRQADLTITHNAAVAQRFADVWSARCHSFDRSFVTADILLDDQELSRRNAALLDADTPLRLVVAGRQIRIKGTDHVLRAMSQAIAAGARLTLDILGDGEHLPEFRRLSDELHLGDVVRFRGAVPYGPVLFDAWAEAQVMVITNLTAEISRNIMLSMARGLPLIMYRNPGTDDLVERNDAGILVPTGDVPALAQALDNAHRDRARLGRLAANALRAAKQNTLDATHHRRAELAASLF